jgi:hypothetical protein
MQYHFFLDETGDHGLSYIDKNFPLFLLCGCLFRDDLLKETEQKINAFKIKYFKTTEVILHSRDIRKCEGAFQILFDLKLKEAFYKDLNKILEESEYHIFGGGIPTGDNRLVVAYSGSVNPWVKVLNRINYGVSSYMVIAGPRVSSRFNGTNPVQRAILITGENDGVGRSFAGGDPLSNVATQYDIILKDVGHTDYGYDPDTYDPSIPLKDQPVGVKASRFIKDMAEIHDSDKEIVDYFKENSSAIIYTIDPKTNIYDVHVDLDKLYQ